MNSLSLPEDCAKQWELLLLLLSSEEKKIDRTNDDEVEMMKYFYNNEGIRKILQQWLKQMVSSYAKKVSSSDTATKSEEVAHLWRQRGNENFRKNCVAESYRCYTKSVLYAKPGSKMYPLALANRSAALLRLKKYEECISDIEMALANGYPEEQRHKLYLRQADCYTVLRQPSKVRTMLDTARQYAQKLQLPTAGTAEFHRHVKELESKLALLSEDEPAEKDVVPSCLNGENENFVSASGAIEIRQSDMAGIGRHVVARQAAQRGDVLFVEEPYACVALPIDGDLAVVCEACCRPDLNAVPCEECSRAVYCSERCRAAAWREHHRWECGGAQASLYPTIGIAHLALRVLLVSAHRGFPPLSKENPIKPATVAQVFRDYSSVDKIDIYKKSSPAFYRMFNLVTNFDKMNNTDYIQYALTATMLTLYLEMFTSFFEYLPSRIPFAMSSTDLRQLVACLILRALGQLVCNGHAALSLCTSDQGGPESRTVTEREVRHATAIYPSAAMMNHSCDPNIINTFYRNRLVIRCARELPANSEVFNCYGPHRSREPSADRRAQLRAQYMFTCSCDTCTDPDRKDFVLLFSAYSCQSCKGPVLWTGKRTQCQQCKRTDFNMERAAHQLRCADELMIQAERACSLEERCARAQAALKLRQQVWHRHNTSLREAADHLANLYVEIGDFSKSIELIKHNIQSLEYQYGSFSVEVAHDLRKLADVMLERIVNLPNHPDYRDWCLETHKIIKKAGQLMELNYGSWQPLMKRLVAQQAAVAALLPGRSDDHVACVHRSLHYNLKI